MIKSVRILLAVWCVGLAVSCIDKVKTDINRGVDIAALEPMTDFEVPVKASFTTVVSLDGKELAVTRSPLTISVPARAVTRADGAGLEITYSDEDIFGEYGYASYWHYLAFEDTRNGDCDFNDVVLHCMVKSDVPWNYNGTQLCKHKVAVQPVALGGSVKVGFGFLYRDDSGDIQEYMVTDDLRRDFYNGDSSFPINTDPAKPVKKVTNYLKKVFSISTREAVFKVVWFVQNGADRLYAATTNFGANRNFNMINDEGMPYGIALTETWCYPIEKCHIRNAYPHFDEWLRSGDEALLLKDRIGKNAFLKAVLKDGENGSLWDYSGVIE